MTEGLLAALVSGGFGVLLLLLQQRSKRGQLREAWQTQAEDLIARLSKEHDATVREMVGQMTAKDAEAVRLLAVIAGLELTEVRRLAAGGKPNPPAGSAGSADV